jgi:putative ABC transport system substrate-binding protein
MSTLSPENILNPMVGFHQGLKEAGYVESQNVVIEYRWAQGHYDRLPELAADLVRRKVAVIVASGGDPSPQIAKAATQTIPIVFGMFGDPVREGLVDSLSRPGGNATGVTIFGPAAVTKRLQLLHDLVPQAAVIAFLMNPNNPNGNIEMKAAQTAAASLGRQIVPLVPAAKASWTPHLQVWCISESARFLVPPILFSLTGATRLSHWQHTMGYRRSTICATSLMLAV